MSTEHEVSELAGHQEADLAARREELAWACRILYLTGQADITLGHVSARIPGTDTFLMKARGRGFDEVTPDDIITLDLNGRKVAGRGTSHGETPMHTEIYRARPDVGCIIHAHPALGTALTAMKDPLPIVSHDGVCCVDRLRVYEGSAEMIKEWGQGGRMAAALGDGSVLLLRNHGTVIAERDVRWAVITSVILERAIAMFIRARSMGEFVTMPLDTARTVYPTKYREDLMAEYWDYFVRRCGREGLGQGMPVPRPVWSPADDAVYRGGNPLTRVTESPTKGKRCGP